MKGWGGHGPDSNLRPCWSEIRSLRFRAAEGRYLAGGLLYFNRDNPWVLVPWHSVQGVALNLAHRTTHIAAAYLTGLIILATGMARLMR